MTFHIGALYQRELQICIPRDAVFPGHTGACLLSCDVDLHGNGEAVGVAQRSVQKRIVIQENYRFLNCRRRFAGRELICSVRENFIAVSDEKCCPCQNAGAVLIFKRE